MSAGSKPRHSAAKPSSATMRLILCSSPVYCGVGGGARGAVPAAGVVALAAVVVVVSCMRVLAISMGSVITSAVPEPMLAAKKRCDAEEEADGASDGIFAEE